MSVYLSQSIDDGKSSVQIKYVDATKIIIIMVVITVTPKLHGHVKEILLFFIMVSVSYQSF